MKKKEVKEVRKVRKNFRFPPDLAEWVEWYADSKGSNVTQVIIEQLSALRDRERAHATR